MSRQIKNTIIVVEIIFLAATGLFALGLLFSDLGRRGRPETSDSLIGRSIIPTDMSVTQSVPYGTSTDLVDALENRPVAVPGPTASPTAYNCGPIPGWDLYTVQNGDMLDILAYRYKVSIAEVQRINCMGESEVIAGGQNLFLPQLSEPTPINLPAATPTGVPAETGVPVLEEPTEITTLAEDPTATPTSVERVDSSEIPEADSGGWVEITPGPAPGYVANPGIGWQYYWSSPRVNDIPQTVAYGEREILHWKELNPGEGVFNWSLLDSQLNQAIGRGEQYSFRVYTSSDSHRIPQWVLDKGAKLLSNGDPDYSNCVYQTYWGEFVNALVSRYDGNSNIAFIDISGYSDYNEWAWESQTEWDYLWAARYTAGTANSGTMSTMDSYARRRLADIFIGGSYSSHQCKNPNGSIATIDYSYSGFLSTQLVLPYAGIRQSTQYVFLKRPDVGFRHDCLGRASSSSIGDVLFNEINGIWRNAPVVLETCLPGQFDFASAQYQLNDLHASLVHNAKIGFSDAQINELAGYAGYRYRMRYAGYSSVVNPGGWMEIRMAWANVGLTPAYPSMGQNFSLHVFITDQSDVVLADLVLSEEVTAWRPALSSKEIVRGTVVSEVLPVPAGIPAGPHKIKVGIINSRTGLPINLDVDLANVSGLYQLGTIMVVNP